MKLVKFGDFYLELIHDEVEGWSFRPTLHSSPMKEELEKINPWEIVEVRDFVVTQPRGMMRSQFPSRGVISEMKSCERKIYEIFNISKDNIPYVILDDTPQSYLSYLKWDFGMFSNAYKIIKLCDIKSYVIYDYLNDTCFGFLFESAFDAERFLKLDYEKLSIKSFLRCI